MSAQDLTETFVPFLARWFSFLIVAGVLIEARIT